MSSSGNQKQSRASQGKSPTLRRRTSKSSREPGGNQTNAQTFDGSGSYAGAFSQSTQVGFKTSLRDVASSVSALRTGLGRIASPPIFRNMFSSGRTADQLPPSGQSDSLTDDFCSSVTDAPMLPEIPLDTSGSFDAHQWGPIGTDLLAFFTSGTEASPGLNTVPNNMQLSINTQTPSHITDLVDHSAASEYAGYSAPHRLPSASVENPGDHPNGPQSPGYWRSQAQVPPYSAPDLPCSSLSGPPPEAASTSRIFTLGQSTNQNELQGDTPPSNPGDGISLERPFCPVDGTVVAVRRDTCVKIRFDMVKISRSTSITYAGLKIPCTLSVKNRETTSEHKLLGLQILVFGTVSGLQYESICDDCKKKENRPGSLSLIDFHSRSDVVLPLRNSDDRSICISFNFHCYPKHYNNNDSEYRLEVLLRDQEQQGSPIVRFCLPYTFNIVAKRTRDQSELEDGGNLPARLQRNTRRKVSGDNRFVRSCSVRPSTQQRSSGSSGSLDNVGCIPSQSDNPSLLPTGAQDRASPAPQAESSPIRIPLPSATFEETMDGRDPVIEGTNPGRGPITGGLDIWIYGSNLPDGSRPLYVKFGENVTRVNILLTGLLSCKLPSRRDPGKVSVWLSRGPTADAPPFGESLCEFEYFKPLNEIVSTLLRILQVPNPQQAAALEVLVKEATSSSQEDGDRGQRDQRGGMSDHDIESAIIHVLEPLQKLANFGELVSMTNDYNQTLAHFASLSGYFKLLKRLVEWSIDLTIADVNGLTPLHCAYKGGCRACIELLLDAGASGTVLDAIGRTPADLMLDGFELLIDALSLGDSTEPIDEKSKSNSVTGARPEHNGEGCYSDNDLNDQGGADSNKARRTFVAYPFLNPTSPRSSAASIAGNPPSVRQSSFSDVDNALRPSTDRPPLPPFPTLQKPAGHPLKPTKAERTEHRYLSAWPLLTSAPTTFSAAPTAHKASLKAPLPGLARSDSTEEPQRSTASQNYHHHPAFLRIEEGPPPIVPRRLQYPRKPPSNTHVHSNILPQKSAPHSTSPDPQLLGGIWSNSRPLYTTSPISSSGLVHRASPHQEPHSSPKTPLKKAYSTRTFSTGDWLSLTMPPPPPAISGDQQRLPMSPPRYTPPLYPSSPP